jgi:hypothetical protein
MRDLTQRKARPAAGTAFTFFFRKPQVISDDRSEVDGTRPTIDEEAGNRNFIDDFEVSLIEVVVRQERWTVC